MAYRRRSVSFNLDNPNQKKLHDFCDREAEGNFSGFVKMVLFLYMYGQIGVQKSEEEVIQEVKSVTEQSKSDLDCISDIL